MLLRTRLLLAAAAGGCLGVGAARAADPDPAAPRRLPLPASVATPAPLSNQQLADLLVARLRGAAQLRDYAVSVSVERAAVTVTGRVADQSQREEVVRLVQGVPGVERVRDQLQVGAGAAVQQVQAEGLPKLPPPIATPVPAAPEPGGIPEPVPLFQAAPPAHGLATDPPRMPPYAWPTYAPYNNFSRVAYPEAYPYQAWPFIGPVHPFPKVPLGWRAVKLEWDDGFWWYSRTATKYDWWKMRFW